MPRLLVATRNPHKTREIAALLGSAFTVADLNAQPGFPEVAETGATFRENAMLKAEAAARHLEEMGEEAIVMADDSGLEVDALHGAPGVRSARFAGEGASDRENLELLLARLEGVAAAERGARFRCVIALACTGSKGHTLATFEGACEGAILDAPRGSGGFGYDPVFVPSVPPGETRTFAELPQEAKNRISHRAIALQGALAWLREAGQKF